MCSCLCSCRCPCHCPTRCLFSNAFPVSLEAMQIVTSPIMKLFPLQFFRFFAKLISVKAVSCTPLELEQAGTTVEFGSCLKLVARLTASLFKIVWKICMQYAFVFSMEIAENFLSKNCMRNWIGVCGNRCSSFWRITRSWKVKGNGKPRTFRQFRLTPRN